MCIGYASRPHLSSRLTRSGRTFLLKPESFGLYDSHINLATYSVILTRVQSTSASALTSPRMERSPTNSDARPQISDFRFQTTDCLFSVICYPPSVLCSDVRCLTSEFPSFGMQFSPVKFSAQGHSTSELLRTLLMSGCF